MNPQFLEDLRPYIDDAAEATGLQGKKLEKLKKDLNEEEKISAELKRIIEISKSKIDETVSSRIRSFLKSLNEEMDNGLVLYTAEEKIQEPLIRIIQGVCKDSVVCDQEFISKMIVNLKHEVNKIIERGQRMTFEKTWEDTIETTPLDDIENFLKKIRKNLSRESEQESEAFLKLLEQKLIESSTLVRVAEALVKTIKNQEVAEWLAELLDPKGTEDIFKELNRQKQIIELVFPEAQQKTLNWLVEKINERFPENARKKMAEEILKRTDEAGEKIAVADSLEITRQNKQEFRRLKYVGGNFTSTESLSHFKQLKYVGGFVKLTCQTQNIGGLEYVGGFLDLDKSRQLKSLNRLRFVGGSLDLPMSLEDLGSLQHVGGNLSIRGSDLKDLGRLQKVEGKIYCHFIDDGLRDKLIQKFGREKIEIYNPRF